MALHHIRTLALAAAGLCSLSQVTDAADLAARPYAKAPPAPMAVAYNWTGFYVGGTVGAAWTTADVGLGVVNGSTPLYDNASIPGLQALGSMDRSATKAIFGGRVGYNWQWQALAFGLEGDISSFRFNRSEMTTGNPFEVVPPWADPNFATFNSAVSTTWLATVRARAGFAIDRMLVYATGGAAFANTRFSNSYVGHSPLGQGNDAGASSASKTRTGWAAGAGIDYGLTENWIMSVEYLHVDLGSLDAASLTTTGNAATATFNFSTKLTSDIVRAGISYKF
jgi:outer membrane immunogenic protein